MNAILSDFKRRDAMGQDNSQPHSRPPLPETVQSARKAAAATYEGEGHVLNDYNTFEEYVNHRGNFLAKHTALAGDKGNYFPVARRDASQIFPSEKHELSVQEVRRREIAAGLDPLLPLPTTTNTATLNNFEDYPDKEFTPVRTRAQRSSEGEASLLISPETMLLFSDMTSSKESATVSPTPGVSVLAQSNKAGNGSAGQTVPAMPDVQDSTASPEPESSNISSPDRMAHGNSPSITQATSPAPPEAVVRSVQSPVKDVFYPAVTEQDPSQTVEMPDVPMQGDTESSGQVVTQNVTQFTSQPTPVDSLDLPLGPSTTKKADQVDQARSDVPASQAGDVLMSDNTQPGDQMVTTEPLQLAAQQAPTDSLDQIPPPPSPAGAPGQVAELGDAEPEAQRFRVAEGVAAMSNRGISVPIKKMAGTKRAAEPEQETPQRSHSKSLERQLQAELDVEEREPSPIPPPAKKVKTSNQAKDTAAPKAAKGTPTARQQKGVATPKKTNPKTKAASTTPAVKGLDAIVHGDALPKSKDQARKAALERHALLLARHEEANAAAPRRKSRRKQLPDLMPEFHEKANFTEPDGAIRCVCGALSADEEEEEMMIQCEECDVWQHNEHMGEAVPKDLEKGTYLCQVCDPFAHRRLLQTLRKKDDLR